MKHLHIHINSGDIAPKYDHGREIVCSHVTITEQGTVAGLPMVDFVMHDSEGNQYLMVMTGRLVNLVSAAIKGVNMRIHGREEL